MAAVVAEKATILRLQNDWDLGPNPHPFPMLFFVGLDFFPLYFLFVIYLEDELFKMGKILLYIL